MLSQLLLLNLLLALLLDKLLELLSVQLKAREQSVVAVFIASQLDLLLIFGILELLFAELCLLTRCTLLLLLLLQVEGFRFAATFFLDFLGRRESRSVLRDAR